MGRHNASRGWFVAEGRLRADVSGGVLKRELGDLDRVTAWLMVYGMVNVEPHFTLTTNVIKGFSELTLELYGPEVGEHARMAPGLPTLPLGVPVTIAAKVAIGCQRSKSRERSFL